MRKNVLALSIAAMIGGLGLAGVASADVIQGTATVSGTKLGASLATKLALTPTGIGHQLIVPYYTAQSGNITVLHLVNTDIANGKVAKVRFRGAANSDDVFDLDVLLSPADVWTAYVSKGSDGTATLTTADTTCTFPKMGTTSQSFKTSRLNPFLTGDALLNQTREGYVEILNTADVPPGTGTNGANSALFTAIKHVANADGVTPGVPPCTTATLNAALFNTNFTAEAAAAAAGFASPTGGLFADWYVQNTANTTVFSGSATALVATDNNGVSQAANFAVFPQAALVNNVTVNNPEVYTADPLLASSGIASTTKAPTTGAGTATTSVAVTANYLDLPDLSTPYVVALGDLTVPRVQAATLTQALAVKSISNQYARDAGIGAQTDWVFSMPTRRYSVALNYLTATTAQRLYAAVGVNGANAVGTSNAGAAGNLQYFSDANTAVVNQQICVNADNLVVYSREEDTVGAVFSPSNNPLRFCGETSVLSFASASPLGASVAQTATTNGYINGWGVAYTSNTVGGTAIGLPIIGHSYTKISNTSTNQNYGITWAHRFTR